MGGDPDDKSAMCRAFPEESSARLRLQSLMGRKGKSRTQYM